MKYLILIIGLFSSALYAQTTFYVNKQDSYQQKYQGAEFEYLGSKYETVRVFVPSDGSYVSVYTDGVYEKYYVMNVRQSNDMKFFRVVSDKGEAYDFTLDKMMMAFFWEKDHMVNMLALHIYHIE
jgi:hypothetical protein